MRSIKEMLMNLNCKNFLECFYGLNESDIDVFRILVQLREAKIDELSKALKKSENSVYKSLQKLLMAGLVIRDKKLIEGGGYYYTYKPSNLDEVVAEMHKVIDAWYVKIKSTIDEFAKEFRKV
ncbi:MAG TPA: TrmB family transcriptional regulator [Archaeoglobus veneficus]|nr:TrmB family transcriptional regulator [Archaeoglobus veneficus]